MAKIYITLVILLFLVQVGFSQKRGAKIRGKKPAVGVSVPDDSLLRQALKIKADEVGKALIGADYEKLFNLTHPKVRQMAGGKDKFVALISQEIKEMEAGGFKIVAMEATEPDRIVKVGNQMFAIVPIKLRFQTPQEILVQESFDIGVFDNKSKTWLLIGGGGNSGKENFRSLFPLAADRLNFPVVSPPYPHTGQ